MYGLELVCRNVLSQRVKNSEAHTTRVVFTDNSGWYELVGANNARKIQPRLWAQFGDESSFKTHAVFAMTNDEKWLVVWSRYFAVP